MFSTKIVNHGGSHGNAMRVLARWWHSVASIEAWGVLHWAMRSTLHHRIPIAFQIFPVFDVYFFVVINFVIVTLLYISTSLAYSYVMGTHH